MKKSECFHLFIHSWNLFYYYDHLALGDENVPIQGPVFVLCVCELERYWEREREQYIRVYGSVSAPTVQRSLWVLGGGRIQ